MNARRRAAGLQAVAAIAILGWCGLARAGTPVEYDIPAAPLSHTLREIGRQGRIDILFPSNLTSGRWSSPLKGRRTAEAALNAVAEEAGLEVVRTGPTSFLLRARARAETFAGQDQPSQETWAPRETQLSEMVVTALRRPEYLQRSPASITLITEDRLSAVPGAGLSEIGRRAPGLIFTENGTGKRRITMRGIQSSGENTVGLYIGDTPLTGPSTATSDISQMSPDPALVDVNRLEALRGPQGTLYGAGAMSGAVKIIYNSPDLARASAEAAVRAEQIGGGGSGYGVEAVINAPLLQDRLGVRFVAHDSVTPGYVDNVVLGLSDVNRGRTSGGRMSWLYVPRPRSRFSLVALHQRQRIEDSAFGRAALADQDSDNLVRLPFPNDLTLISASAELPVRALALTLNSSASRWDTERYIDTNPASLAVIEPATYCPAFAGVPVCDEAQKAAYRAYVRARLPAVNRQPARVESWTHEARLSASGGALSWSAGVFLERRRDHSESGTYVADAATGRPLSPPVVNLFRTVSVETDQTAVFGEARLEFAPRWTLTAGLRRYAYDKAAKSQILESSYINGAMAGPLIRRSTHHDGVARKVNLAFEPSPNLLVYAQAAEGFRPGGVNTVPNLPEPLVVFEPDSLMSYEMGLKASLDGGRATLNLAAFQIDWRDMQARARRPSFTYVANVGASRVKGLEVEAEAEVARGLRLQAGLSLVDARLTKDQTSSEVGAGRRGNRIPFEPDITASAGMSYTHRFGDRAEAFGRLDYVYTGHSASAFNGTSPYYETMGGFGVLDLRAGFAMEAWRVDAWVSNLLNCRGAYKVESDLNSEQLTLRARPRTIGVGLSRRF